MLQLRRQIGRRLFAGPSSLQPLAVTPTTPTPTTTWSRTRGLKTTCGGGVLHGSEDKELQDIKHTALESYSYFESRQEKNKQTFKNAIDLFNKRDSRKRGSVEFILAALKNMKPFGVHRDLDTYRALVDILPKGKYVPENSWQAEFKHYPKQQECVCDVMGQMQQNQVVPDLDFGRMLENVFGMHSDPYKKYMRMMYWMPKFQHLSPWPVPFDLPDDTLALAKLAVERITSVDRLTQVKVYDCKDVEESVDKTWIVSGQSPEQQSMIQQLPKQKALYVEGAFRVWLRDVQVNYFILRGEPVPRPPPPAGDVDDVSAIRNWVLQRGGNNNDNLPARLPNVHEQEDGTILACCATGTSSRDSLLSWVRLLQRDNPDLEDVPILFTLTSPLGPVIPVDGDEAGLKAAADKR